MKILIEENKNYCIYKVGVEYLYEIAEFIVKMNYKHHVSDNFDNIEIEKQIRSIYQEEL